MTQSPPESSPSPEPAEPNGYKVDGRLIAKACVGLLVLLGISYLCGVFLRDPIVTAGEVALDRFGLMGLYFGAIFTDSSPLPLTNEPLMLLGISAGQEVWEVFVYISAGSVTAGAVGYTCGRYIGEWIGLGNWIRRRYPGFEAFMKRWGAWGVAICAFLPIPFALSTWSAGMGRVHFGKVMAAALIRIPKTAFYLWLIVQGWGMGADG